MAPVLDPQSPRAKKLLKYLNEKLRDEGWETPFEFQQKSRVPFSPETIRKVFGGSKTKATEPTTIALVLQHLNVPPHEIRRVLRELTDDQYLWKLMPEEPGAVANTLTPAEEAWVGIYRKISVKPEALQAHLKALPVTALAAGADISSELEVLERKEV